MTEKWAEGIGSWDDLQKGMEETAFVKCPTRNGRMWMPAGSEKTIVFLTARPPFSFWEHSMKIGKDFRNWATCLGHLKMECILCALEGKVQKYHATPFTIIDRSEYELKKGSKSGTMVKDQKKLLVCKNATLEKIVRKAKILEKDGKSLRLAEFKVYRSKDEKSPSTGDDFDFIRMVDPKEFEDISEFNYEELFAPNPELVQKYILQLKTLGESGKHEETAGEISF